MANFDQAASGAITGAGTEGPFDIQGVANGLGLVVSGTFVASVQAQVSFDGAGFGNYGSPLTVPGYLALPPCHSVQLVTAFTSGQVDYGIGGLRSVDD